VELRKPKRKKSGVSLHLTVSKYVAEELERVSEELHIAKSAIVILALEAYYKERGIKKREEDKA
jgi:hypothetical protein